MSEGKAYKKSFRGDWKLVGNGKSSETLKVNMVPNHKWTVKWENLDEYEGDVEDDEFNFNLTSATKGEKDVVSERHMKYKNFYKHLSKNNTGSLDIPALIHHTDNDHFDNESDSKKEVPNVESPINLDTVVDLNIPEQQND